MKIAITSDEHLEFADHDFENTDNAEVLILGGDILVVNSLGDRNANNIVGENTKSQQWHGFMQRCAQRFPHVVMIMGNHEHYHGNFSSSARKLKEAFAYLPNVHVLDNETWTHQDVTFVGGTLWTNMNNSDALTLYHIGTMMNDFRVIWYEGKGRKFRPVDAFEEHVKFTQYVQTVVEGRFDQKFVVVGHHAPSKLSTKPQYQDDYIMNGGYSSDLSEFILDHPQIRLWTHGHTHDEFDYMVGSTRVVCNPRGYEGHEARADQWQLKTVEV